MGFAKKIFRYVTRGRGAEAKRVPAAPHAARGSDGSLPEFLDEVPRADEGREEREGRQHQWRPRPLGDDLPLSG